MSVTNPTDVPSFSTDAKDREREFRRAVGRQLSEQATLLRGIYAMLERQEQRETGRRRPALDPLTGEEL